MQADTVWGHCPVANDHAALLALPKADVRELAGKEVSWQGKK